MRNCRNHTKQYTKEKLLLKPVNAAYKTTSIYCSLFDFTGYPKSAVFS